MINRREALKSLVFIPLLGGKMPPPALLAQVGLKHFLLFFDARVCDVTDLAMMQPPEGVAGPDAVIYYVPVKLGHDQTIDDAIRLYEVG